MPSIVAIMAKVTQGSGISYNCIKLNQITVQNWHVYLTPTLVPLPMYLGLGDTDFLIHTIIVQQNIAIYDNIVIFEITIIITPEYARSTLFSY